MASTVLAIPEVSALISSQGLASGGVEDRHRETSFSATELTFNRAFRSVCHSLEMVYNQEKLLNPRKNYLVSRKVGKHNQQHMANLLANEAQAGQLRRRNYEMTFTISHLLRDARSKDEHII